MTENTTGEKGWETVARSLGTLAPHDVVYESDLAEIFRCTPRSIKQMVKRHELPRPIPTLGRNSWTVGTIWKHNETRMNEAQKKFTKARGL